MFLNNWIRIMKNQSLGDLCKYYERVESSRECMPGVPVLARLDGRSFHNYTRNLKRPFDENFKSCITETVKSLIQEFSPVLGYITSDEITLLWYSHSEYNDILFNGRFHKLTSILSSYASVAFYKNSLKFLPHKKEENPVFDCRVWNVPTLEIGLKSFLWRESEAVRNSINSVAQSLYSQKQLSNKGREELLKMIADRGVDWFSFDRYYQRGSYFQKTKIQKELSSTELEKIGKFSLEKNITYERSVIEEIDLPIFLKISDKIELLKSALNM